MTDPLAAALDRLASVLERIEEKLDGQPTDTGTVDDACRLLKIAPRTLQRRLKHWTEGSHYWYEGNKLVFDLELLKDWQRNRKDPSAHQRAIEVRRQQLPSSVKKKRRGAPSV